MQGKKNSSLVKRIVDVCMTVLLLCLMAYQVTGEQAHEWIGMGMTLLVIVHQILNRKWYGAVFRGRYTAYRALSAAVNILLLLSFVLTAFSGIDGRRPCQKNTPFHVALVLCPDGTASWDAPSGDGGKMEEVGQNEIIDFGNLLRHRRNRSIPLSPERNAGLSALPCPVCFPGL